MQLDTSHPSAKNDGIEVVQKEAVNIGADGAVVDHGLHRALKQRHLQMIALGGVVGFVSLSGCGLPLKLNNPNICCRASIWYGTGLAISYSGPVICTTPGASNFENFGLRNL